MKRIDNKGQVSIEWLILLSVAAIILSIVIFVITNSATTEKESTNSTINQLKDTIKDL